MIRKELPPKDIIMNIMKEASDFVKSSPFLKDNQMTARMAIAEYIASKQGYTFST